MIMYIILMRLLFFRTQLIESQFTQHFGYLCIYIYIFCSRSKLEDAHDRESVATAMLHEQNKKIVDLEYLLTATQEEKEILKANYRFLLNALLICFIASQEHYIKNVFHIDRLDYMCISCFAL